VPTIAKAPARPKHASPGGALPRWGDRRRMRIGLLGGSFNPLHEGHLHIARAALARLRLDQVWLLVSPGNPLKPAAGMAPLAERLAYAQTTVDGRRIIATDIESHLHTRYTLHTLRALRRRFPRARFVWLMGADNLQQFPRWKRWLSIAREMQIAVLPRPTYTARALSGQAARRLRRWRVKPSAAPALTRLATPAWVLLATSENPMSATQLREQPKIAPGESP